MLWYLDSLRRSVEPVIPFAKVLYGGAQAFFRGLRAMAAGSVAGSSFLFRPSATVEATTAADDRPRSWLAFCGLALVAPIAGVSCARLRFRAAIELRPGLPARPIMGDGTGELKHNFLVG